MQGTRFPFAKSCLVSAVAVAMLAGCGGGGGGGKKGDSAAQQQPVTVSGAAAKGIIKNGVVTIYGVNANGQRGAELAQGRTSETDGTYSLTVSGYRGPVIVEITALEVGEEGYPSVMVCDIPGTNSCHDDAEDANDIGFGEDYELLPGFKLKAVVPDVSSGQNVTTNVTALTDMAARLAEDVGIRRDSVHMANSKVRALFELAPNADITTLPVVDVTKNESLAGAEKDALKAALLSASVLAAAKKDGHSIETAHAELSANFVGNNGQLMKKDDTDTQTTLAEILGEIDGLLTEIDSLEGDLPDELQSIIGTIETDLGAIQYDADRAEPGSLTETEPDEDLLGDGFQKAKALVKDLRDLSTAASLEGIRDGSTIFARNLETASDVISADAGRAVEALSLVATAIREAAAANEEGETYTAENGIEIAVASVSGVRTYSFEGDIVVSDDEGGHTQTVSLTSTGFFNLHEDYEEEDDWDQESGEGSWMDSGNATLAANLTINGTVENTAVSLTIKEGSRAIITGFEEIWGGSGSWGPSGDGSNNEWNDSDSLAIDTIDFDLKVELLQKQVDAPISFNGDFGVEIKGYDTSSSYSHHNGCETVDGLWHCDSGGSENSSLTFTSMKLFLGGSFAYGGESFDASLAVNATSNGYTLEENESWSYVWHGYEAIEDTDEETRSKETANQFVRVNFTLDMETELTGISSEVSVRLTGDRNALRTGKASLALRYEGKAIDANLVLTGTSNRAAGLTITNNQGAALALTESNIDNDIDELTGVITADGKKQADVVEENDIILIRYTNGYVESL